MKKKIAKIKIPAARKNGKCDKNCPLYDDYDSECELDLDTPNGCPGTGCPSCGLPRSKKKTLEFVIPALEKREYCSDKCPLWEQYGCKAKWGDGYRPVEPKRGGCPRSQVAESQSVIGMCD